MLAKEYAKDLSICHLVCIVNIVMSVTYVKNEGIKVMDLILIAVKIVNCLPKFTETTIPIWQKNIHNQTLLVALLSMKFQSI